MAIDDDIELMTGLINKKFNEYTILDPHSFEGMSFWYKYKRAKQNIQSHFFDESYNSKDTTRYDEKMSFLNEAEEAYIDFLNNYLSLKIDINELRDGTILGWDIFTVEFEEAYYDNEHKEYTYKRKYIVGITTYDNSFNSGFLISGFERWYHISDLMPFFYSSVRRYGKEATFDIIDNLDFIFKQPGKYPDTKPLWQYILFPEYLQIVGGCFL
jgi:hypothetical protein